MPKTEVNERWGIDLETLDLPVVCPAGVKHGETVKGPAVECRVEDSLITAAEQPRSLAIFCLSTNHVNCPTWQKEKERIEAGRVKPLIHEVEPQRDPHDDLSVAVGEVPAHLR